MANRIKVLVVEDVEIARKLAKIVLVELGCDVDLAESGEKALEFFAAENYDLILMDIGLPGISGLEVTKEIRKSEDESNRTPIVALTANDDKTYEATCLEVGIDDFVVKPLTKEKSKMILEKFSLALSQPNTNRDEFR